MTAHASAPPLLLVVEDDEKLREAERDVLERAGWKVFSACSVAHAQHLASVLRFDVLLTDIALPDGTGWSLAEDLVAATPTLSPLFASGYEAIDEVARGRLDREQRWRLLHKPFASAALTSVAARALREPFESRCRAAV